MATRLYLRDAAPTNDPGETERSSALPVGDFDDNAVAVKSLSETIGTAETSYAGASLPHTDHDDEFFTSHSSEAFSGISQIDANTWSFGIAFSEGNAAANSFLVCSLYVFREPSTVVGFVYDSDTALGAEWQNVKQGRTGTFSGSLVTGVQDGDYLVFEVWRHTAGQAMNMAYTQTVYYDGTVDVTEGSTASAGSYIETPQDNLFGAAVTPVISFRVPQTA